MQNKLQAVKNDLDNRARDIKQMMIVGYESNSKVISQVILKSSLLLMIYNAVEGTMGNLLMEYFDIVRQKNEPIDSFPKQFRNTIYKYYLKKICEKSTELERFHNYDKRELTQVSYSDITKYLKLYSGNLDSRLINDIMNKIGVILPADLKEPVLLQVKNYRNKLAHGEITFGNASQAITIKELNEVWEKTFHYLERIIEECEKTIKTF